MIKIVDKHKDSLAERDLYTLDIDYIIAENIYEYDMTNAGLNLCIYYNLLPQKTIKYLQSLSKQSCHYKIGLLQRDDKEFAIKLAKSFRKMRKMFIVENGIINSNILSIKKDAIFIVNRQCETTKFENVEFVLKHRYTSYHSFGKYEYYYRNKGNKLDVKGISDDKLVDHDEYMLSFLKEVFRLLETGNDTQVINKIKRFASMYKSKTLPSGYYRELNAKSMFNHVSLDSDVQILSDGYIDNFDIDISYNYMTYILSLIQRFFFISI